MRISILGAGSSGIAAARLAGFLEARPFISDSRDSDHIRNALFPFDSEYGGHSNRILSADLLIISPGIPHTIPIMEDVRKAGIPVVSEIEFASWFTASPIVGITGSNGKTTTTCLTRHILETAGKLSMAGGNLGVPFSLNVLKELKHPQKNLTHILELSSFQLEHIHRFSPRIALILNITPDHLNRYPNLKAYAMAKLNIVRNLGHSDIFLYNRFDDYLTSLVQKLSILNVMPFRSREDDCLYHEIPDDGIYRGSERLISHDRIALKGMHNVENILAAATVAHLLDVPDHIIARGISTFTGVPHRMQFVGKINGISCYNDTKATNTASAIAGITSFSHDLIVILGGQLKGTPRFEQVYDAMEDRVKYVVCYGEAGKIMAEETGSRFPSEYIEDFTECVYRAMNLAEPGDTVLLSPACASFDQFSNFEARGDRFIEIVGSLQERPL